MQKAGEYPNCSPAFLFEKSAKENNQSPLATDDVWRTEEVDFADHRARMTPSLSSIRQGCLLGLCMLVLAGCIPMGRSSTPPPGSPASSGTAGMPSTTPSSPPAIPQSSVDVPGNTCLDQLRVTRTSFLPVPDKASGEGCSLDNAIRVESFGGDRGSIKVSNLSAVSCTVANAMAGWVRFGVDRAAREILGSGVERVETFGAYNCRMVAGTRRLSAHATGEAVDVSAFVLTDGRVISIRQAWRGGTAAEREFLRRVRQSACRRFGIVLSPDYDEAHQDHFHLEVGRGNTCK